MSASKNRAGVVSVKKEYPDPRTLPAQPSWQQPRPQVSLSELIPRQYVSTIARIAYIVSILGDCPYRKH